MQETRASIQNLEVQVGQFSKRIPERPPKTLPGDTEVNPREKCKALTMVKESEPKEVHVAEELKEEKAQEKARSTLLHSPLVAQEPEVPHTQKLQEETKDDHFTQFLESFKKLHINIPFAEVMEKMPSYMAFMKGLLSDKKALKGDETVVLTKECSALIQRKLPKKMPDPGSFLIPCTFGTITFEKALCDLGSSINLIPLSAMKKLGIQEAQATRITLQTADNSLRQAFGLVENVLVQVGELFLPADFVILDMGENTDDSIILGRPFLATGRAIINVERGEMVLRLHEDYMVFKKSRSSITDKSSTSARLAFPHLIYCLCTAAGANIDGNTPIDINRLITRRGMKHVHAKELGHGPQQEPVPPPPQQQEQQPEMPQGYYFLSRDYWD
ncbi:uncharacterized protein LOC107611032 [Arachis ipaensis]|uniref:uncharacterized protein LOC107611032 n=1 Tax=Arachis ipaensis TaxID=130454 RepID=UPI0007AF4A61|nr:uncharacterized protein LOC107611032 [Arachis ipaensis]